MRHIGELDSPTQAQAFAAYLLVQGIESQVDADGSSVDIWIREEDQFEAAMAELKRFQENPADPRYTESLGEAKRIVREQEKQKREIQRRIVNVRDGNFGPRPRLTIGLVIACIVVALGTNFGQSPPDNPIDRALQFVSVRAPESLALHRLDVDDWNRRTASLQRGEVWRILTPVLIHHGIIHILFNMYWLVVLGTMLERRLGTWKLLGLVVATGAISNFVQCTVPVAWDGTAPYLAGESLTMITRLGGMSGVVYGLFGFFWMKSLYDPKFGYQLSPTTILLMLIWLVGCIFAQPLADNGIRIFPTNIANWAHGVGLVVGLVLGVLASRQSFDFRR